MAGMRSSSFMGARMQLPGTVASTAIVADIAASLSPSLWIADFVNYLRGVIDRILDIIAPKNYDAADKTA